MLRVRSPAPQEERSIREVAQGSVIICFTWSCLVEMRSEKWPEGTPTTVHVYDMEIEGDPAMHPVNGMQEFSQVYRGWYYRGPSRDGEPCAGDLAIKWARGPGRIRELEREHRNYVEMANMQGEIIPYMYDFLRANVDGVEVACLVLQWCNGKVPTDRRLFVTQRLELVCAFHQCGWSHGSLRYDDTHHFVVDEDDETGNPLRLVDLTYAFPHECLSNPRGQSCREVDIFAALRLNNF